MIKIITLLPFFALTSVAGAATLSDILDGIEADNIKEEVVIKEEPVQAKEARFTCDNCTENEKIVLDFFQDYGIRDK